MGAKKKRAAADPREELRNLVRSLRLSAEASRPEDWAAAPRRAPVDRAPASDACALPVSAQAPGGRRTSSPDARSALARVSAEVGSCRGCPLASTRIKAVPGVGSPEAEVVFIGEGPGYEEDRRGEPFVGKAGELLGRILKAMGLSREAVFIANIVKCHPMKDPSTAEARGNDRPPSPEEIAVCRGFVERQIAAIAPRVVVCLGAVSAKALLGTTEPLSRLRGRWAEYRLPGGSGKPIPVMPTYHPAALLRDETLKPAVWSDMKAVLAALGREAPR